MRVGLVSGEGLRVGGTIMYIRADKNGRIWCGLNGAWISPGAITGRVIDTQVDMSDGAVDVEVVEAEVRPGASPPPAVEVGAPSLPDDLDIDDDELDDELDGEIDTARTVEPHLVIAGRIAYDEPDILPARLLRRLG